uniref:Gag-pol polyprotein n=1 Tax=Rhizophora mucronata TaxID=61149 RepID=A0A2P2JIX9_RHIMU
MRSWIKLKRMIHGSWFQDPLIRMS